MSAINGRVALTEGDLTQASATQKYPLGEMAKAIDDSSGVAVENVYVYAKAHTGLTAFQPYLLSGSGTAGAEVVTAAPKTLANNARIVVPQFAVTTAYFAWMLFKGNGKGLVAAETYAIGDSLEVLNAGTTFIVDGTSGAGAQALSTKTIGFCREAGSTATSRKICLLGVTGLISAS